MCRIYVGTAVMHIRKDERASDFERSEAKAKCQPRVRPPGVEPVHILRGAGSLCIVSPLCLTPFKYQFMHPFVRLCWNKLHSHENAERIKYIVSTRMPGTKAEVSHVLSRCGQSRCAFQVFAPAEQLIAILDTAPPAAVVCQPGDRDRDFDPGTMTLATLGLRCSADSSWRPRGFESRHGCVPPVARILLTPTGRFVPFFAVACPK